MEKGKVDIGLIKQYLSGELSRREMYALERRAQDDPVLMDIILGMEMETPEVHEANLSAIRKRIAARSHRGLTRRLAKSQRWAVAASVLLMLTIGTLWFTQWRTSEQSQTNLASAPTKAEVPRLKRPDASASTDEAASEGVAAEPSPQVLAAAKETAKQRQRRLASTPIVPLHERADDAAEAIGSTSRLTTATQRRSMDTLDDTVVLGYGTQKKLELTGAMAKAEPIREAAVAHIPAQEIDTPVKVGRALAGHTPGMRIHGASRNATSPMTSGKVVDAETQQPLSGVILELADGHTTITDSSGRFVVADSTSIPNASLLGYKLQSVEMVGTDTMLLVMEPLDASLGEVVVTGYGKAKNAGKPEPKDGWRAYRRYLKDERKRADGQKGTVDITFTVDKDGRPVDVKVIGTTNENLNSVAMAIVRNGPDWRPGNDGSRVVEMQIAF